MSVARGGGMKRACAVLLALGALPIAIFPFVLLANVMSRGGESSGKEPFAARLVVSAFCGLPWRILWSICGVGRARDAKMGPWIIAACAFTARFRSFI